MRNLKSVLILILIVTALSGSVLFGYTRKTSNNSVVTTQKFYSDTLKTLVFDNTITQSQSNSVLLKVLQNVNESEGCINGLSELVTNNVITESQATIISNDIQISMNNVMQSN